MKFIFMLFFLSAVSLFAQNEFVKWEAAPASYEINNADRHDYTLDRSGFGMTILSVLRNGYYFFVSDLDGDNCAFSPSCSAFFLQAVKETSIFKGALMFADRFTRDINFFKGLNHYPQLPDRKFYDPSSNYTLHSAKIKFNLP